jgi:O-antigen/teichoic acid export membrane protein
VRESWPEIIAAFSGLLFMRLDQIMLEALQGEHAVGLFAVAAKLSEAWYFIPVALVASAFPRIIQSRSNTPLYYSQISRLMVALVSLSYIAGLSTLLLSGTVIKLLYGNAYADSATILSVHIWCGLFVALGQVSGAWIMAERRVVLNLQRNLFGLVTNILLNFIVIPRFGAIGAAWSTFIAMISAYYLFDALNPSTRHMFGIKTRALFLRTSTTHA